MPFFFWAMVVYFNLHNMLALVFNLCIIIFRGDEKKSFPPFVTKLEPMAKQSMRATQFLVHLSSGSGRRVAAALLLSNFNPFF